MAEPYNEADQIKPVVCGLASNATRKPDQIAKQMEWAFIDFNQKAGAHSCRLRRHAMHIVAVRGEGWRRHGFQGQNSLTPPVMEVERGGLFTSSSAFFDHSP